MTSNPRDVYSGKSKMHPLFVKLYLADDSEDEQQDERQAERKKKAAKARTTLRVR
jgi:hypothetical protein